MHWDNLYNGASVDDDFSLGAVFLMMIVNSVMYGVLTWYIENVFPGEFGTPQPWYFPFTKSYWCGSFEKVLLLAGVTGGGEEGGALIHSLAQRCYQSSDN